MQFVRHLGPTVPAPKDRAINKADGGRKRAIPCNVVQPINGRGVDVDHDEMHDNDKWQKGKKNFSRVKIKIKRILLYCTALSYKKRRLQRVNSIPSGSGSGPVDPNRSNQPRPETNLQKK